MRRKTRGILSAPYCVPVLRHGLGRRHSAVWYRPRGLSLWVGGALLALLLSACGIRQQIRLNRDGSGGASITVAIDKDCRPLGTLDCSERAQALLSGEGPVAHAEADAETLPFDVRIEPFEVSDPRETGYTLSFDFANLEDLDAKLAPDPTTGRSQTSAFEIHDTTFEPNDTGGFTFMADVSPMAYLVPPSPDQPGLSLAVVLPGIEADERNASVEDAQPGVRNAGVVEDARGGVRFVWNFDPGDPDQKWPVRIRASTCSEEACSSPSRVPFTLAAGLMVAALTVVVLATAAAFRWRSRRVSARSAA